jgi:large subunit ribosomal protein L25
LRAVAGERIRLEVQDRERLGSAESRRLRRAGMIPGVLYGRGHKPHAISVPERELRRVLTGDHGLHAILDVVLEGQKTAHASILKEYQRDPVKGKLIHIDLQEVRLDQPIQAQVAVELAGEAIGSKEGGVLSQVTREITVQALPMEMPDRIELDVSNMAIGDTLRISDLAQAVEGVSYLDDPDTVLATVTMPSRFVEPELEEGEEVAEGEEAAEAPEGAAEAPAEAGEDASAGEPGSDEG